MLCYAVVTDMMCMIRKNTNGDFVTLYSRSGFSPLFYFFYFFLIWYHRCLTECMLWTAESKPCWTDGSLDFVLTPVFAEEVRGGLASHTDLTESRDCMKLTLSLPIWTVGNWTNSIYTGFTVLGTKFSKTLLKDTKADDDNGWIWFIFRWDTVHLWWCSKYS